MKTNRYQTAGLLLGMVWGSMGSAAPLGSAFTYQGQLKQSGAPVNDLVDLRLTLHSEAIGGSPVGAAIDLAAVEVINGLFTVDLDFGAAAFSGEPRWLSVSVRAPHDPTDTGSFTLLVPRMSITPTPYALKVPGIDGHSLDAADGGPIDAVFVDDVGNMGIGTNTPHSQMSIYEDGDASDLTVFTRDLASAGINIITDYANGSYTPGLFWSTANDNPTKPKAGIYLRESGAGTELHLGTSSSYVTGITSDLTIDPNGRVGIGTAAPAAKLHVVGVGSDVNLPTGSISAAEISDEPGVASNTRSTVFDMDPNVQTILSRSITAPASGYVLVIGTAEARLDHTENVTSEALFGISPVAGSFPANQDVEVQMSSNARGGVYKYDITVHGLFPVTTGSHTYYFLAQESGGLSTFDDWSVDNVQLTLVYFPTAYGTVASTETTAADSDGMENGDLRGESAAARSARDEPGQNAMLDLVDALRREQDARIRSQQVQIDELTRRLTQLESEKSNATRTRREEKP